MNNLLPRVTIIVPVFKKYESLNEWVKINWTD